jgi:hypothetical protein
VANAYPELVSQHSHQPGHAEPSTFEDTLRQLLKDSPYLVISFLIHAVLFAVFATSAGAPKAAEKQIIQASNEAETEALPPPPPEPEKKVEEEKPLIEEPTISENENTEVTDEVETADDIYQGKGEFENTGLNEVIGVGGGGGQGFGKLGGRGGKKGGGGGEPLVRAVDDALLWLKNHQSDDGHWSCAGFDEECGKQGEDTICDGTGSPQFDVGTSALALLAFLGAGNTDKEGRYAKTVKSGLRYLVEIQKPDGNFGNDQMAQYTYDHIIATLAMVEAYALTKNHLFKQPAVNALNYMYRIRNPGAAWRYAPFQSEMSVHPNDTSVTGWAILAMTLAHEYGLPFDATALEDSMLFLEEMTDPSTGATGYFERGGGPARAVGANEQWPPAQSESMTSVAVLCRIFADPKLERPNNKEMIELGIERISALPPVWSEDLPGRRDFYFWYYGTYAMYQYGKQPWKEWEKTLLPAVAEHQHREGERKGSWDPQVDPWGKEGGRVYSTAILALTLEVFYRYETVIGSH